MNKPRQKKLVLIAKTQCEECGRRIPMVDKDGPNWCEDCYYELSEEERYDVEW